MISNIGGRNERESLGVIPSGASTVRVSLGVVRRGDVVSMKMQANPDAAAEKRQQEAEERARKEQERAQEEHERKMDEIARRYPGGKPGYGTD